MVCVFDTVSICVPDIRSTARTQTNLMIFVKISVKNGSRVLLKNLTFGLFSGG